MPVRKTHQRRVNDHLHIVISSTLLWIMIFPKDRWLVRMPPDESGGCRGGDIGMPLRTGAEAASGKRGAAVRPHARPSPASVKVYPYFCAPAPSAAFTA
jgi:hypothetical protein